MMWFEYLFVYQLWYGLLIECCSIFMFATLDINATEVVFGEDLSEKDDIYFLSGAKSPRTSYWNQASYSLSLHLYTSILGHMFYL